MDSNGKGNLTKDDLGTMLRKENGEVDEEQVNSMFNALSDENGNITRSRFIDSLQNFYENPEEDSDDEKKVSAEQGGSASNKKEKLSPQLRDYVQILAKDLLTADPSNAKQLAEGIFQIFDVGNRGVLDLEDFKQCWVEIQGGTGLEDDTATSLFQEIDTMGAELITKMEFVCHLSLQLPTTLEKLAKLLKISDYTQKKKSKSNSGTPVMVTKSLKTKKVVKEVHIEEQTTFEADTSVFELENQLKGRSRQVNVMEQKLKRINRKYQIIQREYEKTSEERRQDSELKTELIDELDYQKNKTEKQKVAAEKYRKMCESMKKKMDTLEEGIRDAKEKQRKVATKLKKKTDRLAKTEQELHRLKMEKHAERKRSDRNSLVFQRKNNNMKRKLKQQDLELQRAREEKQQWMKELDELRHYKALALAKCDEVNYLKKENRELSRSRSEYSRDYDDIYYDLVSPTSKSTPIAKLTDNISGAHSMAVTISEEAQEGPDQGMGLLPTPNAMTMNAGFSQPQGFSLGDMLDGNDSASDGSDASDTSQSIGKKNNSKDELGELSEPSSSGSSDSSKSKGSKTDDSDYSDDSDSSSLSDGVDSNSESSSISLERLPTEIEPYDDDDPARDDANANSMTDRSAFILALLKNGMK